MDIQCCCKIFCKENGWLVDYLFGFIVFLDMIFLIINCDLVKKNIEYVSFEILFLLLKNFFF